MGDDKRHTCHGDKEGKLSGEVGEKIMQESTKEETSEAPVKIKGTPKQVAWAQDIKADIIRWAQNYPLKDATEKYEQAVRISKSEKTKADPYRVKTNKMAMDTYAHIIETIKDAIKRVEALDDARYIIDKRDDFPEIREMKEQVKDMEMKYENERFVMYKKHREEQKRAGASNKT